MKIGDVVYSTKIRPNERAKIIHATVATKVKEEEKKKETRTKYIAEYDDGSHMTFYGFDINKTVYRVEDVDGQMTIDDFI